MLLALAGKGGEVSAESSPKLLRTVNILLVDASSQELVAAYEQAPSAFLLAGRPIPVSAVETLPVSGWLQRSDGGLALDAQALPEGSFARLDLRAPEGTLLRSCQTSWPDSVAGKIEKINLAAATSVFPLSEQTINKIEGKALQFQNADFAGK
jgi:hypothetical protein